MCVNNCASIETTRHAQEEVGGTTSFMTVVSDPPIGPIGKDIKPSNFGMSQVLFCLRSKLFGSPNQNKQIAIKIDSWSLESSPAQEYCDKSGFGFTLGVSCGVSSAIMVFQEGKGSAPFFVWFFVLLLHLVHVSVDESRRWWSVRLNVCEIL